MDIWIIQDGEKIGPIHDFEVRRKIQTGELTAATPAWHENMTSWKTLGEISLFEHEFDKPRVNSEPAKPTPAANETRSGPPPLPDNRFLWRRCWARWFDLTLFSALWWFAMWATRRDISGAFDSAWFLLLQFVPWFALEIVFVHGFGFTPGKWLLGLRVVNNDGSALSLTESLRRAARVLFVGIGFGLGPISIVCQIMSLMTAKRLGRPLWDYAGGHRVLAAPLRHWRVAVWVLIFIGAVTLRAMVLMPYTIEQLVEMSPQLEEPFKQMPHWYLPKRN